MTLPSSPPLSGSQVAIELGLSLPLSMSHAWVIALAGKSALPISFSDLLGKTGRYDGSLATVDNGGIPHTWQINFGGAPFFGGTLAQLVEVFNVGYFANLFFSVSPNWRGNILVKNNSTGASQVFTYANSGTQWQANPAPSNLLVVGNTDSFTLLPSN